jgi:hypothetical protein
MITDRGGQRPRQRPPPRSPEVKVKSFAQHRAQVQRMPFRAPVEPLNSLIIQRPRHQRGRQRRDLIRAQTVQRDPYPVLHAAQ